MAYSLLQVTSSFITYKENLDSLIALEMLYNLETQLINEFENVETSFHPESTD
jgi:hypothetical protein